MNNNEDSRIPLFQDLLLTTQCLHDLDIEQESELERLEQLQQLQENQREHIQRILDSEPTLIRDNEVALIVHQCIELEKNLQIKLHSVKEKLKREMNALQAGNRARQAYQVNYSQAYGYFLDKQN
jgi:hypothetical protein